MFVIFWAHSFASRHSLGKIIKMVRQNNKSTFFRSTVLAEAQKCGVEYLFAFVTSGLVSLFFLLCFFLLRVSFCSVSLVPTTSSPLSVSLEGSLESSFLKILPLPRIKITLMLKRKGEKNVYIKKM